MQDPGKPSESAEAAEANNVTLQKLIVEATDLIHSSKDVLTHLGGTDAAPSRTGAPTTPAGVRKVFPRLAGRPKGQERRRDEELSPDIIALIASCGERVRASDRLLLRADGAVAT